MPVTPTVVEELLHAVQFSALVATLAVEKELAGQLTQALLFVPSLYRPTPHAVHAPGGAPLYPAKHRQAVAAVLPAGDVLLATHCIAARLYTTPPESPSTVRRHSR